MAALGVVPDVDPPWRGLPLRTGVCSTRNVEQVRSAGADQVIDYRSEDFTHGDLAESAQPVIERTYPLTDAIRHVELEHARAKVVVTA